MSGKEKKFLVAFIILSILLPFGIVGPGIIDPMAVILLWINYFGFIAYFAYLSQPFWQSFLVSYCMASLGVIGVYLGVGGIQIILAKFKKRRVNEKKKINRSQKYSRWLSRTSVALILLVFLIPAPWTGPIAILAMKLKGVKYGLWYLLIANIASIYFVNWAIYSGIKLFFF